MRKSNQEITDQSILENILSESEICWIAMKDEGLPYLLPFNYGYKNNCIYIHCAPKGKKIDLLRANPRVSFAIKHKGDLVKGEMSCDWTTRYRSVAGNGSVEIITDFAHKKDGLEIIMTHNGAPPGNFFADKHVDAVLILKLTIDSITGKQSSNWDMLFAQSVLNFETERLSFNEISWGDLENIHQLHSIPEVDEFNTLGLPKSIADTREIIRPVIQSQLQKPRPSYTWKINRKDTGEFIGIAGMILSNDKFKLGEIYYKLHPDHWEKGYATETAKRLVKLGFDDLGLHKVEAGVAVGHDKSIKVLKKIGMQKEGRNRKVLPVRGKWLDGYHFAIVEDDPRDY